MEENKKDDQNNEAVKPKELTLGQYRVGVRFNPSGKGVVDIIKEKTAELIDQLEDYRKIVEKSDFKPYENHDSSKEILKLIDHAQTVFEDGAMWAVKAVTK